MNNIERVTQARDTALKTVRRLRGMLQPDGGLGDEFDDVVNYMQLPRVFVQAGDEPSAQRAMKFFVGRYVDSTGDSRTSESIKTGHSLFASFPAFVDACGVISAQRVGWFGSTYPMWERLRDYRHPKLIGCTLSERWSCAGNNQVDLFLTAKLGAVALGFGDLDYARRAGDRVLRFFEQQDSGDAFYLRVSEKGQLVTDFPDSQASDHVIRPSQSGQRWLFAGYSAGFLAKMYEGTGEGRYLEGALAYLDLVGKNEHDAVEQPNATVTGLGYVWAAPVSGKNDHQRLAHAIVQATIESQREDGLWDSNEGDKFVPQQSIQAAVFLLEAASHLSRLDAA